MSFFILKVKEPKKCIRNKVTLQWNSTGRLPLQKQYFDSIHTLKTPAFTFLISIVFRFTALSHFNVAGKTQSFLVFLF